MKRWSKSSLSPGMKVIIAGHAARNGTPTMILEHNCMPDGEEYRRYKSSAWG